MVLVEGGHTTASRLPTLLSDSPAKHPQQQQQQQRSLKVRRRRLPWKPADWCGGARRRLQSRQAGLPAGDAS